MCGCIECEQKVKFFVKMYSSQFDSSRERVHRYILNS